MSQVLLLSCWWTMRILCKQPFSRLRMDCVITVIESRSCSSPLSLQANSQLLHLNSCSQALNTIILGFLRKSNALYKINALLWVVTRERKLRPCAKAWHVTKSGSWGSPKMRSKYPSTAVCHQELKLNLR